jgi:hypothetical protein
MNAASSFGMRSLWVSRPLPHNHWHLPGGDPDVSISLLMNNIRIRFHNIYRIENDAAVFKDNVYEEAFAE